jgi:hypothetical protein
MYAHCIFPFKIPLRDAPHTPTISIAKTCRNFDKINFHSRRGKMHFPRQKIKNPRLRQKKPRPFLKKSRPFSHETSQNFHKALTFPHKISSFFSQKRHFYVPKHHKSHKECPISPEISEFLIAQNARICHPSDF